MDTEHNPTRRGLGVTFDEGDNVFPVVGFREGDWNGFARPIFDLATMRKVADVMNGYAGGPNGEDSDHYFEVAGTFIVVSPHEPTHPTFVEANDSDHYEFFDGIMWTVVPGM